MIIKSYGFSYNPNKNLIHSKNLTKRPLFPILLASQSNLIESKINKSKIKVCPNPLSLLTAYFQKII